MSPTVKTIRKPGRAAVAVAWLLWLAPLAALADSIPRPEGIQQDVKFGAGTSPRDRQRQVDDRRDRYIAALRRIIAALPNASDREALSPDEKRILALWGPNPSAILLRDATQRIRFQLGQADRFREG